MNTKNTPHKWLLLVYFISKHVTIIVKFFPLINFLLSQIKFHEVNLYPTCGQSAQDQHAFFLCGSFKYKTKRSIVFGRAARANFDALAGGVVNAQLQWVTQRHRGITRTISQLIAVILYRLQTFGTPKGCFHCIIAMQHRVNLWKRTADGLNENANSLFDYVYTSAFLF